MKIDVVTLFPEMFDSPLSHSIMKRAIDKDLLEVNKVNFRRFGSGKHQHVDDTPYGGGAGMLLKPEPIFQSMEEINHREPNTTKRIILMDPAGKPFDQNMAEEFSREEHLVFICGHYEGYDERIRSLVTDEVSLGDYVLTGGELAAMVMMDAAVRLIPGVLGNENSVKEETFENDLLEYPQFTKPKNWEGKSPPEVLLSGDHAKIKGWRLSQSEAITRRQRPDLWKKYLNKKNEKH